MSDASFKIGNVESPLSASLVNSSLLDADPVSYHLLSFLESVLKTHLGPRWLAETQASGIIQDGYAVGPVSQIYPNDPGRYLQETNFKFPLLSLHRELEDVKDKTLIYFDVISLMHISWILPPLTAGQAENILPLRTMGARIMVDRLLAGSDSNYHNGQDVLATAGIANIEVISAEYGEYPDAKGIYMPLAAIVIKVTERRGLASGDRIPFTGLDQDVFNEVGSVEIETKLDF